MREGRSNAHRSMDWDLGRAGVSPGPLCPYGWGVKSGISLSNKCQLLFGCAVFIILIAALSVPWFHTAALVKDYQIELARQLADTWLAAGIELGSMENSADVPKALDDEVKDPNKRSALSMRFIEAANASSVKHGKGFVERAFELFKSNPEDTEYYDSIEINDVPTFRYARAVRQSEMLAIKDRSLEGFVGDLGDSTENDPVQGLLMVERTTQFSASQRLVSRVFIISAGIVAGLLAILVFYFILTKLIFSPVRRLRETAERVQGGDLTIRSNLKTGDEFEQLSGAFDSMLDQLEQGQSKLRSINEGLDLKLEELAEANVGLYESDRLKSEFLANVSHELRTPLNSIIGFAELLDETTRSADGADTKAIRFIANIIHSGRQLLEMINELLDMAKIEAGRMEVNVESTSIGDLIEGIVAIMRPQAESKDLSIEVAIGNNVPLIETDPGKVQQILYNYLSNAIKFSPPGSSVSLRAERIVRPDRSPGVRVEVTDAGPGIPEDMQDTVFEKFRQIDASHTREHPGTGLGLAICRELAEMLGASVSFVSTPGQGATFVVELPEQYRVEEPQPLMG